MTVAPVDTQTLYALTDTELGPFSTVWPYAVDTDVTVMIDYGEGAGFEDLVEDVDYTLAEIPPTLTKGGEVTLSLYLLENIGGTWGPGAQLALVRETPRSQPSSFGEAVAFSPQASEQALDNLERQIQELGSVDRVGATSVVSSFNGRNGAVVLSLADVTGAGGAPLDSPHFTTIATGPTPPPGTSDDELATTQFVTAAIEALPAGGVGPPGPQGDPGPPGPQGDVGPAGPAGADGAPGAIGPQGDPGPAGPAGADGAAGAQGDPGPAGPAGADGATGPQGDPGPTGPAGADGATGPQGDVGPAGPAGADGATGPQGDVGPAGPAGADGAPGATGPQGDPGPTGPAGADGATGPQGDVGPAGPAGADGATGPQGDPGPAGPTGADGATGPQGDPGATGPAGADGATGPQGDPGPAGPTGPEGPTGPQGPQGPPGTGTSAGVSSFNTRTGDVVLTEGDITGAGGATEADLAGYLPLTGGTLTGPLDLNFNSPYIELIGPPGSSRQLVYSSSDGTQRWNIFCDSSAESGGNAGSNLLIARYADDGTFLGSPVTIARSDGTVYTSGQIYAGSNINSGGSITLPGDLYFTNSPSGWWYQTVSASTDEFVLGSPVNGRALVVEDSGDVHAGQDVYTRNLFPTGYIGWPGSYYEDVQSGAFTWGGPSGALAQLSSSGFYCASSVYAQGGGALVVTGAPATDRELLFETSGLLRWNVYTDGSAESGSNAGSDFYIAAYSDTGAGLFAAFYIRRSDAYFTLFGSGQVNGNLYLYDSLVYGGSGFYSYYNPTYNSVYWSNSSGPLMVLDASGDLSVTRDFYANGNGFHGQNLYLGNAIFWGAGNYYETFQGSNNTLYWEGPSGALAYLDSSGNFVAEGSLTSAGTIVANSWVYSQNGGRFIADGPAGDLRGYALTTSGSWRWFFYANEDPETGSSAGSNLVLQAYNDTGNPGVTAFSIDRANGYTTFGGPIQSGGNLYVPAGGALAWPTGYYYVTNSEHVWVGSGTLATLDNSGNFIAEGSITAGGNVTADSGVMYATGPAGTYRGYQILSAGASRWWLLADSTPESGGNAGSDFQLYSYADNGSVIGIPFQINRASSAATFAGSVTTGGALTGGGNVQSNGGVFISSSPAGTYRGLQLWSSGSNIRWWMGCDTSAEGGSNAGSNFFIANYADNGNNIGSPLVINRASGNVTMSASLTVNGYIYTSTPGAGDNSSAVATTSFVHNAVQTGGAFLPLSGGTVTGMITVSGGSGSYAWNSRSGGGDWFQMYNPDGGSVRVWDSSYGDLAIFAQTRTYFNQEVIATQGPGSAAFRAVPYAYSNAGGYGCMIHIDTSNMYFLITNNNDAYGTWNGLRPFYINLANGAVAMQNGVSISGGLTSDNINNSGRVTTATLTVTGIGIIYNQFNTNNNVAFKWASGLQEYIDGTYQGTIQASCDARTKTNRAPPEIHDPLGDLLKINLESFDQELLKGEPLKHVPIGFIAQNLEAIGPDMVDVGYLHDDETGEELEETRLAVAMLPMFARLVGAIQQQNAKIEQLEARLKALEARPTPLH